jgi:hypothetical protein
MTEKLDRRWWKNYRAGLEKDFRQDRIIVRASKMDLL